MSTTEVTVSKTQTLAFKISKAAELLEANQEVIITAINSAISSAVNLAEVLKHRIKGLHQINKFEKVAESNKTRVIIKLMFNDSQNSETGYQAPIPESEVQEKSLAEMKKLPWETGEKQTEGKYEKRGERRGRRRFRISAGWTHKSSKEENNEKPAQDKIEENRYGGERRRGNRAFRNRGRQARGGFNYENGDTVERRGRGFRRSRGEKRPANDRP